MTCSGIAKSLQMFSASLEYWDTSMSARAARNLQKLPVAALPSQSLNLLTHNTSPEELFLLPTTSTPPSFPQELVGLQKDLLGQWHHLSIHYGQKLVWQFQPAQGTLVWVIEEHQDNISSDLLVDKMWAVHYKPSWRCMFWMVLIVTSEQLHKVLDKCKVAQQRMVECLGGWLVEHPDSVWSPFSLWDINENRSHVEYFTFICK